MKQNKLRVGAGRAVINLSDDLFPLENFIGIYDELCVRVLLIHNESKVAIVSLELTSLPTNEIEQLQKIVGMAADLPSENVWICVTHTFSAPHIRSNKSLKTELDHKKNNMLRNAIEDALRDASSKALSSLTEARVGFGDGYCLVNVNRDIPTSEGYWLGSNERGLSDKSVTVIRFENMDGNPIAALFSYGVQSSIMDGSSMMDGSRLITADLAGAASRYIEGEYGGNITAVFCLGAAGDQAPSYKAKSVELNKEGFLCEEDIKGEGFTLVKLLGKRLGVEVIRTFEKIKGISSEDSITMKKLMFNCPGQVIPNHISDIHPTKQYEYLPDGEHEVDIEAIKLGDIVLLGVKPELCCRTSMEIKEKSPFTQTLLVTMVNGGAKYMADEDSYSKITYESMNSFFAKGSAEILRDKALELLKKINE